MFRKSAFHRTLPLLGLILIGGCSHTVPNNSALLQPDKNLAKIFLYATYDNPDEKPTFSESFRFRKDNGYLNDIKEDQFIETTLPAGEYDFSVEEINWGGNGLGGGSSKATLHAGGVYFFQAHIGGEKPTLSATDNVHGALAIQNRERLCAC